MVSISTRQRKGTPHYRRIEQVYQLLDSAPDRATYEQLIDYVKANTGKGCSRKLISKWKKERSLQLASYETQPIASPKSIAPTHKDDELESIASQITAPIHQHNELEPIGFACATSAITQIPQSNVTIQPHSFNVPPLDSTHLDRPTTNKTSNSSPSRLGRMLTIATATTIGLVGCGSWLNNDRDRPSNYQPAAAIAQEIPATSPEKPTVKRTPKLEPRDIKISLTLSSPEDLKVKPGDKIVKGQTLSDRANDRIRLNARKKQLELTLAKLNLPLPPLTPPKSIQPLSQLPPISYQEEQAHIKLKEQELSSSDKAIANQEQKIKQLRALFQTNAEVEECRETMHGCNKNAISKLSSSPLPLSPHSRTSPPLRGINPSAPQLLGTSANQSLNSQAQNNTSKLQLILSHEQAVLENLISQRKEASLQLSIASAKLTTAKEQRAYSEYQRQLEETKRASLIQQQWLEVQRQQEERTRALQLIEYNKSQIKAQITEINNQISQLSTVAAPYEGTIKKVKWTGQSDHTLSVELTLVVTNDSTSSKLNVRGKETRESDTNG